MEKETFSNNINIRNTFKKSGANIRESDLSYSYVFYRLLVIAKWRDNNNNNNNNNNF